MRNVNDENIRNGEEKEGYQRNDNFMFNTTRESFRVLNANVDVLTNKTSEILARVSIEKPDIITLQEILPKNYEGEIDLRTTFKISGYQMILPEKEMKRGVMIYVNNKISAARVDIKTDFDESVWCEIYLKDSAKLLIGNIYHSPSSEINNSYKVTDLMKEPFSRVW